MVLPMFYYGCVVFLNKPYVSAAENYLIGFLENSLVGLHGIQAYPAIV